MGNFHGLKTDSIETKYLRLEFLTEHGPRIVGAYLDGIAENQFAEVPEFIVDSEYGSYHFWGGHRLWHAPEAIPRTYVPDIGVDIDYYEDGVLLKGKIENQTGFQKIIEIHLSNNSPDAHLIHRLVNHGSWAVQCAPWAITQLPLGGQAEFPFVGSQESGLLPNRNMVFWPYSRFNDIRYHVFDDRVLVDAKPGEYPFKIGSLNQVGWLAYQRNNIKFTKLFTPQPGQAHVDMNCNSEIYVGNLFIELETLGPVTTILPGESILHEEHWRWNW